MILGILQDLMVLNCIAKTIDFFCPIVMISTYLPPPTYAICLTNMLSIVFAIMLKYGTYAVRQQASCSGGDEGLHNPEPRLSRLSDQHSRIQLPPDDGPPSKKL